MSIKGAIFSGLAMWLVAVMGIVGMRKGEVSAGEFLIIMALFVIAGRVRDWN